MELMAQSGRKLESSQWFRFWEAERRSFLFSRAEEIFNLISAKMLVITIVNLYKGCHQMYFY